MNQQKSDTLRQIACNHLVVDQCPIPYSPCVVAFDRESKQVISYRQLVSEEPRTEWVGGTITIKKGEILI